MSETCKWTEDENGEYDTECGHKFEFIYDGPVENGAIFCQYCGKKIIEGKT